MRRRTFLTLVSATATTAVASCSTGPSDDDAAESPASPAAGGSGKYPVTIKHAHGRTKIEKRPARIATLGWSDADCAVALGVAPVGAPDINWGGNGKGSTDYYDAALKKIDGKKPTRYSDADGAPVDEIAKLRPDLILATNSGITKEEFDKLSKLAPVVAYPGLAYGTSWQQSLDMVGRALGMADQAKKLKASTEKQIKDALAKYPKLKGKTAAWTYFMPNDLSKVGMYTPWDNRPRMLEEFGMKTAPVVTKLSKKTKSFTVEISAEKSSTLTADMIVFYVEKPGEDKTLRKHRLLGQIPALKSGAYVAAADNAVSLPMSSPSPLSIPEAIKDFLPMLGAAAAKAT